MSTFRQIQDLQRRLGATDVPISEFSSFVNETTGTNVADAGIDSGLPLALKKFSSEFDRLVESTGLPKVGGSFGEFVGSAFGAPDAGRRAGEMLPRAMADFLPGIAGTLMLGTPAAPLGIGLIGASAGLSGINAYEKTNSPGQAAFSGLLAGAAPGIGKLAGQAGARLLPKTPVLGDVLGGQVFGGATFLGADFAQHIATGGTPGEFFTRDRLVEELVGNAPFAVLDAARVTPEILRTVRTEKDFQAVTAKQDFASTDPPRTPRSGSIIDIDNESGEVIDPGALGSSRQSSGEETPSAVGGEVFDDPEKLQTALKVSEEGVEVDGYQKLVEQYTKEAQGRAKEFRDRVQARLDEVGDVGQAVQEATVAQAAKEVRVEKKKTRNKVDEEELMGWYEETKFTPEEQKVIDDELKIAAESGYYLGQKNVLNMARKWYDAPGEGFVAKEGGVGKLKSLLVQANKRNKNKGRFDHRNKELFKDEKGKGVKFRNRDEAQAKAVELGEERKDRSWLVQKRRDKDGEYWEIRGSRRIGQGGVEAGNLEFMDIDQDVMNPVREVQEKKAETKVEKKAKKAAGDVVFDEVEAKLNGLDLTEFVEGTNDLFEFRQDFMTALKATAQADGPQEMMTRLKEVGLDDREFLQDFLAVRSAVLDDVQGTTGRKVMVGDVLEDANVVEFLETLYGNEGKTRKEVELLVRDTLALMRMYEVNADVIFGRSKELDGVFVRGVDGRRRVGLSEDVKTEDAKFVMAHEMSHGLVDALEKGKGTDRQRERLNAWKETVSEMGTNERIETLRELERVSGKKSEEIWGKTVEDDEEFMANVLAHSSLAMTRRGKWDEFLTYMPKQMGDFLRMVGEWVGQVVDGVKALKWWGEGNDAGDFLSDVRSGLEELATVGRKLDKDVEAFMKVERLFPGGVGQALMAGQTFGDSEVGQLMGIGGESASWFADMFEPLLHFGERHSHLKRLAALPLEQTESKNVFLTGVYTELGATLKKDGSWDFGKESMLSRVNKDSKTADAMQRVLAAAINSGEAYDQLNYRRLAPELNDVELGMVRDMTFRAQKAMERSIDALTKTVVEVQLKGIAARLTKKNKLNSKTADQAIHRLKDGLRHGSEQNVKTALLQLGEGATDVLDDVSAIVDIEVNKDLFGDNVWVMAGEVSDQVNQRVRQSLEGLQKSAEETETNFDLLGFMEEEFADLDVTGNHLQEVLDFARTVGGAAARQLREADFDLYSLDEAVQADKQGLARVKQAINNFDVPDTELGQKIAKTNFLYFLGGNVGSHFVEAMSPFMILPNFLTEAGSGIVGGYKLAGRAALDVGKFELTGQLSDKTEMEFMKEVEDRGAIGVGTVSELTNEQIYSALNARRAIEGKEPMGWVEFSKTPMEALSRMAFKLYGVPTSFNERTALLAAFRHFKGDKKLEVGSDAWKEVVDKSVYLSKLANGSAGRAGRAVGVFSAPKFRTASQALASLQQFSWGQISSLVRFIQKGYTNKLKKPPGVSDAEWQTMKLNSRKAAKQMLATTFLAAGAMGLPGVGAAIALVEKYTDWEVNKLSREFLAAIGGEGFADLGLRGMWHAMPGAPDLGVKFGIGNVLGTDNWNGWSVDGFIGPTASLVENILTGGGEIAKGNVGAGMQRLAPAALKRLMTLYRGDGKVMSSRGELLLDPTAAEKVYMALGFNPSSLSKIRDRDKVIARSRELAQQQGIQEYDNIVELLEQEKTAEARAKTVEYSRQTGTPVADVASRVAARYERHNFARDPRNRATRATAAGERQFLQTYGQPGPSTEVERLLARAAVRSQLSGEARMPTTNEIVRANMVARLMNQGLTRVEARGSNLLDSF